MQGSLGLLLDTSLFTLTPGMQSISNLHKCYPYAACPQLCINANFMQARCSTAGGTGVGGIEVTL